MRPKQTLCIREGCDRLVKAEGSRWDTCTPSCSVLQRFSTETDAIINLLGPCEQSDLLREATDDLVDCFDDLLALRRRIKSAAHTAGISNIVWSEILRGQTTQ
jgi:hypothetical protein